MLLYTVASRSAVGALRDPERADLVAALGDTTGQEALKRMHRLMLNDEGGRFLSFWVPCMHCVACYEASIVLQELSYLSDS